MGVGQRDTRTNAATITVAASNSLYRTRADYVCDANDDGVIVNYAIEKIKDIGGAVALMGGDYKIRTTPMLQRQAVRLDGEGIGATRISLHAEHTLTTGMALVKHDPRSNFIGGGISGISFVGDGGVVAGTNGIADLTATVDGIDASGLGGSNTRIFNYHVNKCSFQKFRRAWNGEGCRERFVEFKFNEFWYNNIGTWMGEHINVHQNDYRYNDIGITGKPYDANFNSVRICYNRIGITGNQFGDGLGVTNCYFQGGAIFANTEDGLTLYRSNNVSGVHFGASDSGGLTWVKVNNIHNQLAGCTFYSQSAGAGASTAAIYVPVNTDNLQVVGCTFNNLAGPCFQLASTKTLRCLKMNDNQFQIGGGYPIMSLAGAIRESQFCNNTIRLTAALAAPLIEVPSTGTTVGGNQWNNNAVYMSSGYYVPTCFFKGILSRSQLMNNNFLLLTNYYVPILDASTTTTDAMICNNGGGTAFSPIVCNHGATAATARPPWPGVVQWIGSVEPTNMIDGDVWINTG